MKLVTLALFASLSLSAGAVQIVDVVKNADGSLNKTYHSGAIVHCSRLKARLMTTREWAEFGVANGAQGMRETNFPKADPGDADLMKEWNANQAEHYYVVTKQMPPEWSTKVDFYYNGVGYKGTLPDGMYWAAEVAPAGSDVANVFQVSPSRGSSISYVGRTNPAGVVCVR